MNTIEASDVADVTSTCVLNLGEDGNTFDVTGTTTIPLIGTVANIEKGLAELRNADTTELNICWLEDIEDDDTNFWVDVCEDTLDALCATNWAWTVISKAAVDKERRESLVDYSDDENECVIVVDVPFSENVVKTAIEEWLRDRGFEFTVNVIDPEGTVAMNRVLDAVESCEDL